MSVPKPSPKHTPSSASAYEKLQSDIDAFYEIICNTEVDVFDLLDKTNDEYFTISCTRCATSTQHVINAKLFQSIVMAMSANLEKMPPSATRDKCNTVLFEFLRTVNRKGLRPYVDSAVMKTPEWGMVLALFNDFKEEEYALRNDMCQQYDSMDSETKTKQLYEAGLYKYECRKHDKETHFISAFDIEELKESLHEVFQSEVLGHELPEKLQILADNMYASKKRKFGNYYVAHTPLIAPQVSKKTEKLKEKKLTPNQALHIASVEKRQARLAKNPTYILNPDTVATDWLVEFQICGRKIAHETIEDAELHRLTQYAHMEESAVESYKCPYSDHYHVGRNSGVEVSVEEKAQAGYRWYRKDILKANDFIQRIMLEGF